MTSLPDFAWPNVGALRGRVLGHYKVVLEVPRKEFPDLEVCPHCAEVDSPANGKIAAGPDRLAGVE